MKVSILGPRGTFTELAACSFFDNPELILKKDIEGVFESVIRRESDYGIVPVENSLEGSVGMTLELLLRENVKIYGEKTINIKHSLMAQPGTKLDEVKLVQSHPHALMQCREFLRSSIRADTRNMPSTAEAAKEISEKKLKGVAAIAPRHAAELYGLKILKEDIQDRDTNQTRFLVIGLDDHEAMQDDKTSLIFGLADKPGALYSILGIFAERRINLTKIESRPSRKALGDYIFYVDFEGHREDKVVAEVLQKVGREASFLKVLGSYPKG